MAGVPILNQFCSKSGFSGFIPFLNFLNPNFLVNPLIRLQNSKKLAIFSEKNNEKWTKTAQIAATSKAATAQPLSIVPSSDILPGSRGYICHCSPFLSLPISLPSDR